MLKNGKSKSSFSFKVDSLVKVSVISALYVLLTYISASFGLAYCPIQVRVSESLCVLPVVFPEAVFGLTLGCLVSNLTSPFGMVDIIFGTLATFVAAFLTFKLKKFTLYGLPLMSLIPPVVINPLVVGLTISIFSPEGFSVAAFFLIFVSIMVGELISCYALGVPLYLFIKRSNLFEKLLRCSCKDDRADSGV